MKYLSVPHFKTLGKTEEQARTNLTVRIEGLPRLFLRTDRNDLIHKRFLKSAVKGTELALHTGKELDKKIHTTSAWKPFSSPSLQLNVTMKKANKYTFKNPIQ